MTTKSEGEKLTHVIGSAVMDKHYEFTIADEDIYAFLGDRVISMFTGYIHPEDRENFTNALKVVNEEGESFSVVRIKNFLEEYPLMVIHIEKSENDSELYDLNLYDMVYLVREYESINDQLTKTKLSMQLLNPVVAFDYTSETGLIRVYSDKDALSFEGNLDDWYNDFINNGFVDKVYASTFTKLCNDIKDGVEGMSYTLGVNFSRAENITRQVVVRTTPVYDSSTVSVKSIVGVMVSSNQEQTNYDIIFNKSNLDPLTGLYNKAAIKDYAIEALNTHNGAVTYVMMDLDHFKEVNDTYGHMFGDEVILNAARIIKNVVGKKGYVGRIGGDEFFAVLIGVGSELEELRPVLRAIRSQVEWAYRGKLGNIKLTVSVGCASYPKDADNYNDLFKLADNSLYCAKNKGRDRFVIYTKEIHGSLEDIMAADKSIHINHTVSESQRLEFVTFAVNRLCDWGSDVISPVIRDMLKYFTVNVIDIYDVATRKCLYSTDELTGKDDDNICYYIDDLSTVFRESNIFSYGDSNNLKVPYPEFYAYTQKEDYRSLLIYAIKDKGEITHLISAYSRGKFDKFSDTHLNYYNIIFRTIGDKLLD